MSNQRFEEYETALREAGIKFYPTLVEHGNFNRAFASVDTKKLRKMKIKPDAVFAVRNRLAFWALPCIRDRGYKVDAHSGPTGFHNKPITCLLTLTFGTIDQPAFEMGKLAAPSLFKR